MGQPAKFDVKRKVEGLESVTVPAGTFDAVRISGNHCNLTHGGCGGFIVWYALKAKYVAKITWASSRYWPGSLQGQDQVLLSYEVHSP